MPSQPERIVIESRAELAAAAASWIAAMLSDTIHQRGQATIALSGGSTPRATYHELATRSDVLWSALTVLFGDERAVPPTDPASNYRMACESLLDHVPVARSHIHRMQAERADLDAAARDYARLVPDHIDVLLLGIGPDGHTASLFPGAAALDERERLVVPVQSPFPPPMRLTITPPVIAAARHVAVIVGGADKAGVLVRALEGPFDPHVLPVQLARRGAWFVEREAAANLHRVLQ